MSVQVSRTADSEVTAAAARTSLSIALGGHRNSLGLLRLVLASLVIFEHAFPLGGFDEQWLHTLTKGQETIGGFAVVGFFAISGYLVAKSGISSDILQFLWKRTLRIFPAFWLVLIVSAALVGPVFWLLEGHDLGSYFTLTGGGPVSYLVANWHLQIRQWGIHDIFGTTTPYGANVTGNVSVFNGSLWTLAYEWGCYLVIAVLVVVGVLKRARIVVVVLAGFCYLVEASTFLLPGRAAQYVPMFGDNFWVTLTLSFLIGACFAMYSRSVPFDFRLAVLSAVLVVVSILEGGWVLLGYPAFSYLLLWAAAALPKKVQWIGAKNDYSYGMYVYGFLVQQGTAYFGWYTWGYFPWVTVCLVITFGCAWVSWHAVEKWALALKDWGPGRGLRYWAGRARAVVGRRRRAIE
jgi:peptidoglycan/LPS O-acetylase OafA/YrhL